MNCPIFFCDTETTGLSPDQHDVWEVAVIYPRGDDWKEPVWQLPVDLGRADPTALKIGRFYERRGVLTSRASFAAEFARLTFGLHMVGAVPSFDAAFLSRLLRAEDQCPGWHYHLVDVEALIAGKFGMAPPWDSDELSRLAGVDPDQFERHSALGDARWAKALYDAVISAEENQR